LQSVAAPGGVAVSAKAYLEAGKHVSAELVNAGHHHLKNIGELVNIWTWEPAATEASGGEPKASSSLPAQYRNAIVGALPYTTMPTAPKNILPTDPAKP